MDADQLNFYRINYNVEFWTGVAEKVGNQCSSPVGAVLAVNALCDEVERLRKERDELKRMCHTQTLLIQKLEDQLFKGKQ